MTWWNLFVSWLPFLLLIAFWIFFMTRQGMNRQGELMERSFLHMDRAEAHMQRVEAQLERIAVGIERQRASMEP
jgi:ATP-dependent Zn protease